ncbi:hypothetical protein NST86_30110 [Bacillus sp. FSL L8-0199]|uniref:hypothetical protein n=1 Tax=Bacillus TaxID=1386 RepID=UPI000A3D0393|nr:MULTISPECIES: hypothetical protein [Bacillus cereus group]MCC2385986.1 hypothetical protein [Bacillus cereus]MCU5758333.1 hypothetical protein [Bacillus cereus]OUB31123.1 hypothetical protein BK739_08855 [Bacillus thuringiensis serovar pirenaica]
MGNIFDSWNEGIDVDITQSIARIVVNGIDLPFTSVRTTAWINGPANDLIVTTRQRVNELYRVMWSRVPVMLKMYFIQGADIVRFARVAGVDKSITGEYIYHFIW